MWKANMKFIYTVVILMKSQRLISTGRQWFTQAFFHQLLYITLICELKLTRLAKKLFLQACDSSS